jgi:hypothetical protein
MLEVKIIYLLIGSLFGFLMFYLISRIFPSIDYTTKTCHLIEGHIFRISKKKVFLVHVLI